MRRGCGGKIGCNALRTVRKPDQHTRFIFGFAIYLVWQNRENPLQAPANITGQANADQTHVRVDQLNFAAQNNIARRCCTRARKSADTISWTASALFQTRKEASKRPLGEHSP